MQQFWFHFIDNFLASYTGRILFDAWQLFAQLWPWLLGGILLATFIRGYISRDWMAGVFKGKSAVGWIFLAAMIGIISPLGSYVMIPLSAALLVTGVPLPILMSLMVASPLMNPNLFVLTAGAMGLEMALMRSLSALLLGCFAGFMARWFEHKGWYRADRLLVQTESAMRDSGRAGSGQPIERSLRGFAREFYKMSCYISRYFFLAILLASVLKMAINPKWIIRLFDGDNLLSVMLSAAAGVPFYVCGGAAIPVVQQLAELGMSKGAVLAFFISGPAIRISNLVILQATFRRRILWLYLAVGILGAVLLGGLYNLC